MRHCANAEVEPEPEVDLSKLRDKVASLDVDAKPQFDVGSESEEEPDWLRDPRAPPKMSNDELETIRRDKEAADEARGRFAR